MAWLERWGNLFRKQQLDADLDEELRFHLDARAREHAEAGLSSREAEMAARRAFGNVTLLKERTRQMDVLDGIEVLGQELRYAVRRLLQNPGFMAVAVLSLALGIGANTAMFSVIYTVLLRPLPYQEPERLVAPLRDTQTSSFSMGELGFWRRNSGKSLSLAGYRGAGERSIIDGTNREWITTVAATAGFFQVLGVAPALGREFSAEEARLQGPQALVLTHALWKRTFGGDPGVLGRGVRLDGESYTVVGILPAGFWFPQAADAFCAPACRHRSQRHRCQHGSDRPSAAWCEPGAGTSRSGCWVECLSPYVP